MTERDADIFSISTETAPRGMRIYAMSFPLAGRQCVVYSRSTFVQTGSRNPFSMARMSHKPIVASTRSLRAAAAGLRLNLLLLP